MNPELYKSLVRPILFKMDPEEAHKLVHAVLRNGAMFQALVGNSLVYNGTDLSCDLFGTKLSCPVGLAAGFDKNADLVGIIKNLGFGFAEVGSVTGRSSQGNPKPRLFRLPEDDAVINRMGLNGQGADVVSKKLANAKSSVPLGLNIAKTNDPSITGHAAIEDIVHSFKQVKSLDLVYITINASCPNTKEGITTEAEHVHSILSELQKLNDRKIPLLLKLSPDSSLDLVEEMVRVAGACSMAGFVCSNTTTSRDGLHTTAETIAKIGNGGLSGAPLKAKALQLCKRVNSIKQPSQIIIGCGGISSGHDAYQFIAAGASLVQIYTGLVYQGPGLPALINRQLSTILRKNGQTLGQAIGSGKEAPAIV